MIDRDMGCGGAMCNGNAAQIVFGWLVVLVIVCFCIGVGCAIENWLLDKQRKRE